MLIEYTTPIYNIYLRLLARLHRFKCYCCYGYYNTRGVWCYQIFVDFKTIVK